jgi:hypothetical protein
MADGKIRFLRSTLSPEVFKAMVTLKGSVAKKEKPDDWDEVAPKAVMEGGKEPPKKGPKEEPPAPKPGKPEGKAGKPVVKPGKPAEKGGKVAPKPGKVVPKK